MLPVSRRQFLSILAAVLPASYLPIGTRQTQERIIFIPVRESLPAKLLYRVVDRLHPILDDEIKTTIEPGLQSLPLTMDGILVANEHVRVHSLCEKDLAELFAASNSARTGLYIHSGFRSYEEQAYAYSHAKDKNTVLLPGTSQHHTGLALDFTSSEIGKLVDINSGFEQTKAAKWLVDHAWEYGYLPTYTSNHDEIRNELWHYLYTGRDMAKSYRELKAAGWYGDVFLLQTAIGLGMDRLVLDGLP